MKLRKLCATAALVALLGVLSNGGCSKPAPKVRTYEELIADEIRALERLRAEQTARWPAEGKTDAQIKDMQAKVQDAIDKLKNPPPVPPPDDLPPGEPDKKGSPEPEKKGSPEPDKKGTPEPNKKG